MFLSWSIRMYYHQAHFLHFSPLNPYVTLIYSLFIVHFWFLLFSPVSLSPCQICFQQLNIHHFIFIFPGIITNQISDHFPVGLLAQLVRPCSTVITEVTRVQTPASLTFFSLSFRNCLSCMFNCDDLPCIYLKALCLLSRPLWRDLLSSKGKWLDHLQPKFGWWVKSVKHTS